jgi:hypothetical protein
MFGLGLLCGVLLCLVVIGVFRLFKSSGKSYTRTGLWETEFSEISTITKDAVNFKIQLEVGELISTNKKTKVEVISMNIDNFRILNSPDIIERVKSKVNNSWVLTSDIDWIKIKND